MAIVGLSEQYRDVCVPCLNIFVILVSDLRWRTLCTGFVTFFCRICIGWVSVSYSVWIRDAFLRF